MTRVCAGPNPAPSRRGLALALRWWVVGHGSSQRCKNGPSSLRLSHATSWPDPPAVRRHGQRRPPGARTQVIWHPRVLGAWQGGTWWTAHCRGLVEHHLEVNEARGYLAPRFCDSGDQEGRVRRGPCTSRHAAIQAVYESPSRRVTGNRCRARLGEGMVMLASGHSLSDGSTEEGDYGQGTRCVMCSG